MGGGEPREEPPGDRGEPLEQQKAKVVKAPYEPTRQEVEEHEATGHVVYRSWCRACLAGRGYGQAHRAAPDQSESAVPTILSDYGFMGQDDGKCMPLLVMKDSNTKRVAYSFVQAKGVNPYATKFASTFVQSTGYRNIVNKSDGEHSIVALKREMLKECPLVNAVPQEIPLDDHQANGEIETEVREAKKLVRTGKIALESKLQMQLTDDDPMLAWLPRHQADQVNRYRIGEDGKTPEQRRTGKKWRKPAIEFGEKLMIREAQTSQQRHANAFQIKMVEGRYIGHHGRTGALLVLTSDGVKRGVGARRLPLE